MARLHRPSGLAAGIAIGAAIALSGVLFGVTVASIPSSNGVINACYNIKTGALRVVDAPGKHCVTGEGPLSWTKSVPASAVLNPLAGLPCALTPDITGTLNAAVDPGTGLVTLRCVATTLSVVSNVALTRIELQTSLQPIPHVCLNAKTCSLSLPPGSVASAIIYASVPFHITCPGAVTQGSGFDTTHTINWNQCLNVNLASSQTVKITSP
jgi:hypothetical protein